MADDTPKFGKSIERITILSSEPGSDKVHATVFYRKKTKKRASNKLLKPLETLARIDAETRKVIAEDYLERHRESNARKSNGWLRDLGKNVYRACKAGRECAQEVFEEEQDRD